MVLITESKDKFADDEHYRVTLRSYGGEKGYLLSSVVIECKNFSTFKEIVESVDFILDKERIKD